MEKIYYIRHEQLSNMPALYKRVDYATYLYYKWYCRGRWYPLDVSFHKVPEGDVTILSLFPSAHKSLFKEISNLQAKTFDTSV